MFLELFIMFLSSASSLRIHGNECEHCNLEANCYILEDFLNRIPFSFYRYFYSRIHCGYKGHLATICCNEDFLENILRELNTETINSHKVIENPHLTIENPHGIIINPHDTIINPHETIIIPHEPIINPHDTMVNPHNTIVKQISTIITHEYDYKKTSTEGTFLTQTYKINDQCEIKESRIIGGVTASLGLFPWMAKLGYTSGENPEESTYKSENGKDLVYRCGGSLVTLRHVLTAAHCLVGLPNGMVLTVLELDADRDRLRRFPISIISHPGYNDSGTSDDLGIVKLNRPVALSNAVMPICLPIKPYIVDPSKLGRRSLIVAGWGTVRPESTVMSDRLRYTRLNYMDSDRCRWLYRTRYGVDINDGHLCTVPDGRRDACYGDSGGPLFTWADGGDSRSAVLIAVVSFGSNVCAASDVPPVFTRIDTYMDWIMKHID